MTGRRLEIVAPLAEDLRGFLLRVPEFDPRSIDGLDDSEVFFGS